MENAFMSPELQEQLAEFHQLMAELNNAPEPPIVPFEELFRREVRAEDSNVDEDNNIYFVNVHFAAQPEQPQFEEGLFDMPAIVPGVLPRMFRLVERSAKRNFLNRTHSG